MTEKRIIARKIEAERNFGEEFSVARRFRAVDFSFEDNVWLKFGWKINLKLNLYLN